MEQSVAILMSTYNGEKYLEEQIESLLAQTYRNIIVYVRDDGSTDSTLAILERYRSERFIIFSENNIGVVGSFFELLKLAGEHDYYAFCDQDDVWHVDKIENEIAVLVNKQIDPNKDIALCFTGIEITDAHLALKGRYPIWKRSPSFENAMVQNIAAGLTTVMTAKSRRFITDNLPDYSNVVMHDWWTYLVVSAFGKVFYLSTAMVKYRQHSANNWGANVLGVTRWYKRIKKYCISGEKGAVSAQLKEFNLLYGSVP